MSFRTVECPRGSSVPVLHFVGGVCCTGQRGAAGAGPEPFPPASTCTPLLPSGQSGVPPQPPPEGSSHPGVLPWLLLSLLCSLRAVGGGRGPAELASLVTRSAFSQQPTALSDDGMGGGRLGAHLQVSGGHHSDPYALHGVLLLQLPLLPANQPSTW